MEQTVYCTLEFLKNICIQKNNAEKEEIILPTEINILYTILYKFSDIVIDITYEDYIANFLTNPIYKKFSKKSKGKLIPLKKFFDNISEEDLSTFPSDIFLIDNIEIGKSKEIRTQKGAFILCKEDIPLISIFNTMLDWDIEDYTSWDQLFKEKRTTPINSAIIVDNYLFKEYKTSKEENLFSIIRNLIPKELTSNFHLTLVTNNFEPKNVIAKERAEEIVVEIQEKFKIKVGIITHWGNKKIHKRVIMTNHHFLRSDKGFNVLKNSTIKEYTDGETQWVFNNINNYKGQCMKEKHFKYIDIIKEQLNTNFDNGNIYSFNAGFTDNRLLK